MNKDWNGDSATHGVGAGPISDFITRKAYVAGYDRRMRHPAWAGLFLCLIVPELNETSPIDGRASYTCLALQNWWI